MDVLQKKLQQMPYYFCYCYDIYLPFLLLRICLASLIVTIIAGCDVISTVFQLGFRINGKIKTGYYKANPNRTTKMELKLETHHGEN
jgi:hypothetical protein